MKKSFLIPVIALVLALAVLTGVSAGISAKREANAVLELNAKMNVLLPGSDFEGQDDLAVWINGLQNGTVEPVPFNQEEYAGEDANIRAVYKGEGGYVIATETYGYAGEIAMLIGVSNDGRVTGLQIRDMSETPGLGMNALNDVDFLKQFLNSEGGLEVGTNVDAISGATVTSKAIARSVNSAVAFVTGADIASTATTWGG